MGLEEESSVLFNHILNKAVRYNRRFYCMHMLNTSYTELEQSVHKRDCTIPTKCNLKSQQINKIK